MVDGRRVSFTEVILKGSVPTAQEEEISGLETLEIDGDWGMF